ncbi:unnamed protein product [Cuscuta europaea]|uniref:Uncharacterized protein n=1 Tax=Cuscuta europaea TaxID=41803 RepID=A0A9P0YTD1_CUSEU|nr:unnamed protein product [Cuscuta europaea]
MKNYANVSLIWDEIFELVRKRTKTDQIKHLPYMRWFSLIVRHISRSTAAIPRRLSKENVYISSVQRLKKMLDDRTLVPMTIPVALLQLADPNDLSVRRYCEEHNIIFPMAQINPPEPTPGSQPSVSEGLESSTRPQRPVASWPHDDQTLSAEGHTHAEETTRDSSSIARTLDADDEDSGSKAEESDNDDSDEDDDDEDNNARKAKKAPAQKGRFIIRLSRATNKEGSHLIKNTEGQTISETRSKVCHDNPSSSSIPMQRVQTDSAIADDMTIFDSYSDFEEINRANPIGAETDIFSFRVEDAALSPTAHAQAQPSHSAASQQVVVSQIGDTTPTSLPPYDAVEELYSGLSPRTTTPPSSTMSLGVTLPTFSNFSRTPTLLTPLHSTGSLYLSITIRDTSMMIRSPTAQQITQSLSAGHTSVIFTDAVITVTTLVTGQPEPTDLSVILQSFMDSTIKPWVHEAITARAQEFMNTQALPINTTQPQPSTSHSQQQLTPILTLQTSEPSTTQPQTPTTSRGTQDTERVSSPTTTTPHPNPYTIVFEELESIMLARILATEEGNRTPRQKALIRVFLETDSTCRDRLCNHKRSHEDPDDSDPHEGENKRQQTLEHGASTSQQPTHDSQPESSNNQPPSTTQPNSQATNLHISSMVELDKTLRGISLRDFDQGWSGSPEVATSSTPFYSDHQEEPSSILMTTGNPCDPGLTSYEATQMNAPSEEQILSIYDELEKIIIDERWNGEWTEWDEIRPEVEQYEMQRGVYLRDLLKKCDEDLIELEEDELKEGENYKKTPA